MGQTYIDERMPHCPPQELASIFETMKAKALHTWGNNPYNGSWSTLDALEFLNMEFPDARSAYRHLIGLADRGMLRKWGNAIAVVIVHKELSQEDTQALADLDQRISDVKKVLIPQREAALHDAAVTDLVARAKASHAPLLNCTACGSKIAIKHVKTTECPVCGSEFLRRPGDARKINAVQKQLEDAHHQQLELETERAKLFDAAYARGRETHREWYIGGVASSR